MRDVHGHVHGGGNFKTLLCLNLPPELESNWHPTCVPIYVPSYVPRHLKNVNVSSALGSHCTPPVSPFWFHSMSGKMSVPSFFLIKFKSGSTSTTPCLQAHSRNLCKLEVKSAPQPPFLSLLSNLLRFQRRKILCSKQGGSVLTFLAKIGAST